MLERLSLRGICRVAEVSLTWLLDFIAEVYRNVRGRVRAAMDRTMINDTINLLFITVAYNGRALPLGWVRVPHEGNSDLKLQQQLLNPLRGMFA